MPVNYPVVPGPENAVRARIIKKYTEYISVHSGAHADPVQLQGERYEIAVALALYRQNRFTNGNQISRWHSVGVAQNINVGFNTDYDFVVPISTHIPRVPMVQGPILGEAKSYSHGLGAYIKKAVGYCLNDPSHGGFCFVTPGDDYQLYLQMVQLALAILAGKDGAPGITGGDAWKIAVARGGKPTGPQILQYFDTQYYQHARYAAPTNQNHVDVLQNQHAGDVTGYVAHTINPHTQQQQASLYQRLGNRRATSVHFNQELAQRAGFIIACYQVPNMTHDQLKNAIGLLP